MSVQVDFDSPKYNNTSPDFCPADIDNLILSLNGNEVGIQARSTFLEIARSLVGSVDGKDLLLLDGFLEMSSEKRVEFLLNMKA